MVLLTNMVENPDACVALCWNARHELGVLVVSAA